jgi:hypothetical protein
MHDAIVSRPWIAGWLASVVRSVNSGRRSPALLVRAIQHARSSGMSGPEIAATLERQLVIHPATIRRKARPHLEVDTTRDLTVSKLLSSDGE